LGQEVATLVDRQLAPGTYAATWDARNVASGTYFYQLKVGSHVVSVKKALLIK
jgi:hypothetical protein